LAIDALHYTFFTPGKYPGYASPGNFASKLQHLTSPSLNVSAFVGEPSEGGGEDRPMNGEGCNEALNLGPHRHFLEAMTSLRSLSSNLVGEYGLNISDLIPLDDGWVKLRELSLKHVYVLKAELFSLLRNYAPSL
jgi:hypothetical protein